MYWTILMFVISVVVIGIWAINHYCDIRDERLSKQSASLRSE